MKIRVRGSRVAYYETVLEISDQAYKELLFEYEEEELSEVYDSFDEFLWEHWDEVELLNNEDNMIYGDQMEFDELEVIEE